MKKIAIGTSACILGQKVRFDGGHKRSHLVTDVFSEVFDYRPVCPEMGIGMASPRPAIRLIEHEEQVKLVQSNDVSIDYTDKMQAFSSKTLPKLADVHGFVLAAKSPSCGMERLKVSNADGQVQHRKGVGLFAARLLERYPNLPVEEDGRLNDAFLRENFIERVYAHHAWHEMMEDGFSKSKLVDFHSKYKFSIMAHRYEAYKELGRMVAGEVTFASEEALADAYFSQFMGTLKLISSRKKHTNVLQHIQGFFKNHLPSDHKTELAELILKYKEGYVPLLAPLTLIKHYIREYKVPYLAQQSYLEPFPEKLGLRS